MTRRPLDFEEAQSHQITVRVNDSNNSLTTNQSFTIYVTNVNEAPTSISLSNLFIPENSPFGAVVGIINVTDPDEELVPQNITCGLRNDAGGRFRVIGWELTVLNSRMLNYEAPDGPDYLVDIECQDQGGESIHQQFTVELTDVNEPPVRIESFSRKFEVTIATVAVIGRFFLLSELKTNQFSKLTGRLLDRKWLNEKTALHVRHSEKNLSKLKHDDICV